MTTLSAALLLFLVMDPIGNLPVFISLLSGFESRRARAILVRELVIALGLLIIFLFIGDALLRWLHISQPALGISGGVILFLIAVKMIFANVKEMFGQMPEGEPFIVPLATPLIAGPSATAMVLLLNAREPHRWDDWLLAIVCAWLATGAVLLLAGPVSRLLGIRGIMALERLMGMLLTTLAVQMFLDGAQQFFARAG
jgi:MarC family membrane protein